MSQRLNVWRECYETHNPIWILSSAVHCTALIILQLQQIMNIKNPPKSYRNFFNCFENLYILYTGWIILTLVTGLRLYRSRQRKQYINPTACLTDKKSGWPYFHKANCTNCNTADKSIDCFLPKWQSFPVSASIQDGKTTFNWLFFLLIKKLIERRWIGW